LKKIVVLHSGLWITLKRRKKKQTNKQTNKQTKQNKQNKTKKKKGKTTKSYPRNMESVEKILGNLDAKRAC
jgi:mannitol-specific phosphotransferase system IIBC component